MPENISIRSLPETTRGGVRDGMPSSGRIKLVCGFRLVEFNMSGVYFFNKQLCYC